MRASFTNGERREVVVQQEGFFVGASQRVDELFIVAGAERCNNQSLGFAACKQGRTVGSWQFTNFGNDWANGFQIADHRYGHRS